MNINRPRIVNLLLNWARWADRWWYEVPARADLGCYGTGYNSWGVQTNQKYLAAMAVLSAERTLDPATRDWARGRALQSLRFTLASHHAGPITCTDGTKWGRTWISALGIERMMHGVHLLEPHMTPDDHAALRRVLEDESDWLLIDYQRGSHKDIQADRWGASGKNDPESNLWNGAVCWRTAAMYPDHPDAARWLERALDFMANGVSVLADANDTTVYDGRPLRERHRGASFFDSYALDHHAYFNVGYMVICASNAAMLHFDLKQKALPAPQLLHLHQADLWRAIRPMIFTDGRLDRVGGDSRVRYAYCQEYLLPSLLYAADHLGDRVDEVEQLVNGILGFVEREAAHNGDGSFYGKRLATLNAQNPYYYVRLEGDRVNGLSMLLAYAPLVTPKPAAAAPVPVETLWTDDEYGAAFHRTPHRIASVAWRAWDLSQAMCTPPDASDLAEWQQNLAGEVTFVHHEKKSPGGHRSPQLVRCSTRPIHDGFVSCGTIIEGDNVTLSEGWSGRNLATHYLAYVALPDGRSMVGAQVCRTAPIRTMVAAAKGLRLNVPNDVFNSFRRRIESDAGERELAGAPEHDELVSVPSRWLTVDGKLSVIALAGADAFTIDRSAAQRGGTLPNLNVEQICYPHRRGPFMAEPETLLLDCVWVVSCCDSANARALAAANAAAVLKLDNPLLRAVRVRDLSGQSHVIVLNASETTQRANVLDRDMELAAGEVAHWEE